MGSLQTRNKNTAHHYSLLADSAGGVEAAAVSYRQTWGFADRVSGVLLF